MAETFGTGPQPALFAPIKDRNANAVRSLLESGADVNETNTHAYTALHQTVSHGDDGAVLARLLIEYGADTLAKNCCEQTPLHLVLYYMSEENLEVKLIINRLLDGVDQEVALRQLYAREDHDCTPEEYAISADEDCKKERRAISQYLAARRADLESIFVAVRSGSVRDVQLSVSVACSVNRRDHEGRSLLYCAAEAGRLDMVRYLLAAGADRLVPNDNEDLPLHVALYGGHLDIGGVLVSSLGARGRDEEELRRKQLATCNDLGFTPAQLWTGGGQPPDYLRVLVAPDDGIDELTPDVSTISIESRYDEALPDYATAAQACRAAEPVKAPKEKSHKRSWLHKR